MKKSSFVAEAIIKRQPQKMVKHTQTIRRLFQTNCLTVFDHFVRLSLKGLNYSFNDGQKLYVCL